jgi:sarcosine oxidase subunit gamma
LALAGHLVSRVCEACDLTLTERPADLTLVAARRGQEARLDALLHQQLGLRLPDPGKAFSGTDCAALGLAPGTAVIEAPLPRLATLRAALPSDMAASVDQSGGFAILRLGGGKSPDVLGKGCRLDLHPSAFGPGRCARTVMAQVPTILRQIDSTPSYDLIVPRTLARSFAEFVIRAAETSGVALSVTLKPEEVRKP